MSMTTIGVVGKKGGSGKTTTSHLLARGLALFGTPAVVATTDQRLTLNPEGRGYRTFDASSAERFRLFLERVAQFPKGVAVVDGGATRAGALDEAIAKATLFRLLPVQDSAEDLRVASEDLERLTALGGLVYVLPSRWPTNPHALAKANERLARYLPGAPLLDAVPQVNASKLLLEDDLTKLTVPTAVNDAARALAVSVAKAIAAAKQEQEQQPA